MRIAIISEPKYSIELSKDEYLTLKIVLDYVHHRLTHHTNTGLHIISCNINIVDEMRRGLR